MQAEEIFLAALEKATPAERQAYLDGACGHDAALRAQVEGLLRSHQEAGSFLNAPLFDTSPTVDPIPPERPGTVIGPYKLLEQIGEGGMGTVWMAQQSEPVKRLVAVKLIKAGMDSRQVIARFEAERQALALMDHANIARVLDAGTTSAGRPYFVMDLVRGVPITRYCDEHHLTPRQRLELFIPVCQAIQHAHQKGVIHRDLKPSNVLVALYDGQPVPKVIDFGVAKATGQSLTDKTLVTGFGTIVGTLEYMSPEQAETNQLDIDTRSDIYSLGVLLYELLTGSTPFSRKQLEQAGMLEMLRVIREEEPSKPSTKLSTAEGLATLAANRGTEPAKLTKLVRGELDWIVMKALDKDRSRRYETASGFARDVERYLNDEPVQACPPSAAYRFRKFARRNKGALAITSTVALAVLLALVGLTISNVLITQEKNLKVAALDQAKTNEQAANTQKGIAERNATKAHEQEQKATVNEKKAKASELLARRRYYAAQMNLAMQAWRAREVPRVLELLEGQRPGPDEEDLRGFEWYYLWRLCNSGRRLYLNGHTGAVLSVAFSRDGVTLASASWDGTVRLWDAATGKERTLLRGHFRGPWNVVFSPDGKTLASSGQETESLILWDIATGKPLHTIAGPVVALAFSRDSSIIAGGLITESGIHVKLWDVATGKERLTLRNAGVALGFLPGEKTLVTMLGQHSTGGEVQFWDLETQTQRLKISVPHIMNAALSTDGTRVATSSGNVTLWDTATGQSRASFPQQVGMRALAFSPDDKKLAAGNELRTVVIWDVETGRMLGQDVHLDPVWCVAFSPDGQTVASSTAGAAIKLWDMKPPEEATTIRTAGGGSLGFDSGGRTLLVGNPGLTRVIDVAAGKEVGVLPASGVMAISADAGMVAGPGGADQGVVWDVRAGRTIADFPLKRTGVSPGVALSPDGKVVATHYRFHGDNTVNLWEEATRETRTLTIPAPQSNRLAVECAAFSPDGKLLAAGFQFQWVTVWDVATGKVKLQFSQPPAMMWVRSVAFSPDSKALAVGTDVGAVTLWDVESGKRLASFRGHTSQIHAMAFSPDGRTLASASADRTVRLWDVITGQERGTLTGHEGPVVNVRFSPDGNTLATASGDGTVKLWRAATDPEALARRTSVASDDPHYVIATEYHRSAWYLATSDKPEERDPARAVELAQKAIELFPQSARYWLTLGVAHYRGADWKAAIAALDKSEELATTRYVYAEFFRAMALWQLGDREQARDRYERAAEWVAQHAPYDPWFNRFQCEAAALLGLPDPLPAIESHPPTSAGLDAESSLRQAIELAPDSAELQQQLGALLAGQGKFADAEPFLTAAVRLAPERLLGYSQLADVLRRLKKFDEAVEILQQAIARDPHEAWLHGALGWALWEHAKYAEAEHAFREAVRRDPALADAQFGLGCRYLSQRKFEESIETLRIALRFNPDNRDIQMALGGSLNELHQHAQAETVLRNVIRLAPEYAEAHHGLSWALLGQKKFAEAEASSREGWRLDPKHRWAPLVLADALLSQGKPAEAESVLAELVQREPENDEWLAKLGDVLRHQKKFAEAEAALLKAIQLNPARPWTHDTLGWLLREQAKYAEAELAFREAARLKPDLASAQKGLGLALQDQKKSAEAVGPLRESLRLDSTQTHIHGHLGWNFIEQKLFPESEAEFREQIRLAPDLADGHFGLGRALQDQKKFAEAVGPFRDALRLDPTRAHIHGLLGWGLIGQQLLPEAEAEFREQIRLSPEQSGGHTGLGKALQLQKKFSEAEAALREAIRLAPTDLHAHRTLGWTCIEQKKFTEAEAAFREVIRLAPADVEGRQGLGRALVEQKKFAEAEAPIREVLRLDPQHRWAPNLLKRALLGQGKQAEAEAVKLSP